MQRQIASSKSPARYHGSPLPTYRYEPCYRMAWNLNQIPRKAKRIALEVSAIAALSFTLATVLAANSDDLRNYRAYFLSTAKDCAIVSVVGFGLYRILGAMYGKPQAKSRDSDSGHWN